MFLTKYEGLSYPTHFLKSRDSGYKNTFLEYRTKQSKKEGQDQETIQSSTTPDLGYMYHMGQ